MLGQAGTDYCGYCKASYTADGTCNCNGFGHIKDYLGTCGYCHTDYAKGAGIDCSCDGFGGNPKTHEKACRYCGGLAIGNICLTCFQAQ